MLSLSVAVLGPVGVAALVSAGRRAVACERARRLGARTGWRLPALPRAWLARALADADLDVGPEQAVELWAATAAAVCVLAAALAPGLAGPVALALVVAAPAGLHLARGRRRRRFAAALPDALEQVAAELRGGGTVAGALRRLAGAAGPVAPDLAGVCARVDLGLGLGEALASWRSECRAPEAGAVAGALAVAATVGGRSAAALDGLAGSLRDRLGAAAEARSLSAQARLSAVVVGVAPLAYLVFSALVDPGSLRVLLGTGVGRACLLAGLALQCLAAAWMHRIVGEAL